MRAERTVSGGAGGRGLNLSNRRRRAIAAAAAGAIVEALETRVLMTLHLVIDGIAFRDYNGNSTRDDGEPVAGDVDVELVFSSDPSGSAHTDANGHYTLEADVADNGLIEVTATDAAGHEDFLIQTAGSGPGTLPIGFNPVLDCPLPPDTAWNSGCRKCPTMPPPNTSAGPCATPTA